MNFLTIDANSAEHPDYSLKLIAEFLHKHLEQYGDSIADISNCLDYVRDPNRGGAIYLGLLDSQLVSVCVTNKTGMSGYIPENILVYIAVDGNIRGKGIGKQTMEFVLRNTEGAVALHVEHDNPARKLYERLGFTNKYLEMRWQSSN